MPPAAVSVTALTDVEVTYLRSQLEQYKAYLQNVRLTASKEKGQSTGVGVVTVGGKEKKPAKPIVHGPYRFTHAQLEKEGIIVESNVPDNRSVSLSLRCVLSCVLTAGLASQAAEYLLQFHLSNTGHVHHRTALQGP